MSGNNRVKVYKNEEDKLVKYIIILGIPMNQLVLIIQKLMKKADMILLIQRIIINLFPQMEIKMVVVIYLL